MAQVPIDEVHALATWLSSIFYGALVVLYWGCVWVLTTKRRSTRVNKPMLCTATAMVVIATLHNAVSVQRNIEAFFQHKDGSPIKYFILSSNFANLWQTSLFMAQILVGDGMLVYRCYVTYGRDWRILILPFLLLLGTLACGIELVFQFAITDAKSVTEESYFGTVVQPWSTGVKAVSMAQNIVTTAAIALKIWQLGQGSHRHIYWRTIMLIVESGAIYTVIIFILLILNVAKQNTYAIIYYAIVPIIGIVFTSMIIAVGLRDIHPITTEVTADSVLADTALRDERTLRQKFKRPVGRMIFAPRSTMTTTTRTQDTSESDFALEHGPIETLSLPELTRPSEKGQESHSEQQV